METQRLIIDELKETDKSNYFNNISHDKLVLKTFICQYQEDLEHFDFSVYLNRNDIFAIRLKDSLDLIGIISIFNKKNDSIEIGYAIGKNYWGKGYTTEAIKCFIEYAFEKMDIDTIYASYFVGNIASQRVMEKCNMKYSHIVYNELTYLGESKDSIYYKVEKSKA